MQRTPDSQQLQGELNPESPDDCIPVPTNPTISNLVDKLSRFIEEFKEFDDKTEISTPEADYGIGPVKYDIKFLPGQGIREEEIRNLDDAIRQEQFAGDELIKLDSKIVSMGWGEEDPLKWLPAALRIRIRTEIRETTSKCIEENRLALKSGVEWSRVDYLVRYKEQFVKLPNAAEIYLMCKMISNRRRGIVPPRRQLPMHLMIRLMKRKKERMFFLMIEWIMAQLIIRAPGLKIQMKDETQSDGAGDLEKNERTQSEGL